MITRVSSHLLIMDEYGLHPFTSPYPMFVSVQTDVTACHYWVGPDFIGLQTTRHYSMASSCENMGHGSRGWRLPKLVEHLRETAIFGDALRFEKSMVSALLDGSPHLVGRSKNPGLSRVSRASPVRQGVRSHLSQKFRLTYYFWIPLSHYVWILLWDEWPCPTI